MTMKSLGGLLLSLCLCGCLQTDLHKSKCDFDKTDSGPNAAGPTRSDNGSPASLLFADQVTATNAHSVAQALEAELRAVQRGP